MNLAKQILLSAAFGFCALTVQAEWITDVTFKCADDNNVIHVSPRRIAALYAEFTPADAATWKDVTCTLSDAGTNKDNTIASLYKVNYWKPDRIQFNELQGYREGECKLTVTVKNPQNTEETFVKDFTVVVEEDPINVSDFTDGTIILNEEWFGHTNGSLNYITPDNEIIYQAYSRVNPGYSFGCTSQHGTIWGGYLMVASKQAADGGDPLPGGGRFVIADARTLKRLGSIDNLTWNGTSGDGRAVAGATPTKVYVSASNGIYVIDITDPTAPTVCGKIGGNDGSDLYSNQVGDIINAGRYVFAVQQSYGILAIDTETDEIVKTYEDASVQGITQTADGRVWYATVENNCTKFVDIDPATLVAGEGRIMPESIGIVSCSWGAWRSTSFKGNHTDNRILFISGNASIMGGPTGSYYLYDVDTDPAELQPIFSMGEHTGITDFEEEVTLMNYGTAMLDVRHNRIIAMAGRKGAASGGYRDHWVLFVDEATGTVTNTFKLEPYYWFQSLPIFPDKYEAQLREDFEGVSLTMKDTEGVTIDLHKYITDPDNHDANIRFHAEAVNTLADEPSDPIADFALNGSNLTVKPLAAGTTNYLVTAESNGRSTIVSVPVTVRKTTGINDAASESRRIEVRDGHAFIYGYTGTDFALYDAAGSAVARFTADTDEYVAAFGVEPGIYILAADGVAMKIAIR